MKNETYFQISKAISVFCVFIAITVQGCALKPYPAVPVDVTVPQALAAVDRHSTVIKDFSGTALVKINQKGGSSESVKLSIKYIRPDRFRVLIKGFAGIPVALICASSDSMNIYFPSDNSFITIGRHEKIIRHIVPGFDVEFSSITSILTGMLPPQGELEKYEKTLERYGKQVVLTLKRGTTVFRYTLDGKEMNVVGEEINSDGKTVFSKKASGFHEIDGILFPRKVSLENERGVMVIEFSGCSINQGLTDSELTFVIPASAERKRTIIN